MRNGVAEHRGGITFQSGVTSTRYRPLQSELSAIVFTPSHPAFSALRFFYTRKLLGSVDRWFLWFHDHW